MKKFQIILLSLLAAALLSALGFYVYDKIYLSQKIPQGHFIGKIYVGGMTRENAVALLSTMEADSVMEESFAFTFPEGKKMIRYEFTPSQVGMKILPAESVDDVMNAAVKEFYLQKLYYKFGKKKKVVNPRFKMETPAHVMDILSQIATFVNRKSESATFIPYSYNSAGKRIQGVSLKPQASGREVEIDKTIESMYKLLDERKTDFPLAIKVSLPPVTNKMLEAIPSPSVLGSYTTYYGSHDSPNRIHNIFLVSTFVDNTYLVTGEEFSLIKPVGKFTPERGFKEAYVIIGVELVPEYGGGTCQIATTMYNAAMTADLEIIQRSNHGMYFTIYPLGRDAAVYPPYTDLKFINNTGHPILIQARPFKKGLTFRIYGTPTGKTVTFSQPETAYSMIDIATLDAAGQIVTKKVRSSAFRTVVIKTVFKDGKKIDERPIKSFYKVNGDKQKVKIRRKEPR